MGTKIGKKVWLYEPMGEYSIRLSKEKTYEVVGENHPKDWEGKTMNWVDKYSVRDDEGNEREVDYNYVVFVPNTDLNERDMVADYLGNNGLHCDVYTEDDEIVVSITWGDWKHDHGWADNLMSYIGYLCVDEQVTEENGSDTYSADHYYMKKGE
jgi:hypothetical protein